MKRLALLTAAAALALNACEQHTMHDLALIENETEGGHGAEVHATQPAHEVHTGAPKEESPKFFPKAH
jgi:hypothetical protein